MDCISIKEVKILMSQLLMKEKFDGYLFSEASITTYNTFQIDGHIQKKFYSERDYEDMGSPQLSYWKQIRPLCYEIVKGNRTPLKFKIVLKLDDKRTEDFLKMNDTNYTLSDIGGFYINLIYENNELNCITGTTLNIFSMDKSLEKAWDNKVRKDLLALI